MFWQIASIILQITQLTLQISGFLKYEGKLQAFASNLTGSANNNRDEYLALRACDPDFYTYYKSLTDYIACQSAISRSKGAAFHGYGSKMRRALKTNRGYTPLAKVHLNNILSQDAVSQVGLTRSVQAIKENKYVDNHTLQQWSAIVGAPIGVEKYYSGSSSAIIQQSFTNLKSLGQGFNSAAAAFGTSLHGILR